MHFSPPQILTRLRRAIGVTLFAALAAGLLIGATPELAAHASSSEYFVNCSLTSNGDGTNSKPWNSLRAVNSHGAFMPGDKILFNRATTCKGMLHPSGSGSADAPVLVGAYGSGHGLPTIAGGGTATGTASVSLENQSHWTIQDLHVTNRSTASETSAYRSAVIVMNRDGGRLAGVTLQRLRIDSVVSNLTFKWPMDPREFGGISVITWTKTRPDSGYDGLRVMNNRITKVGRTGIVVSNHGEPKTTDRGVRIAGNRVVRARGDSIILRGSSDGRIDHNVSAYGADFWPCKQCGAITPNTANAGIWPAGSQRTRIDHNEVYGEHQLGGDGVGIDVDVETSGTVVEANYVHDNEGGGILFCGSNSATGRFNILQNNSRGAFVFIGGIPAFDTSIYNNTVYSSRGTNAQIVHLQSTKGGKGLAFFNNLIYNMDDSGYYQWPMTPSTRTNTYLGVHGIGEPSEVAKGWNEPGLINPGSGKIGFKTLGGYRMGLKKDYLTGSRIPSSVTTDFFGKKIDPKKPPRGAAG